MTSLLNNQRPPVFCPGCSHEKVVQALDRALVSLGLKGNNVAIVTDIGCSGLFDTFFNTHALHGLHGRALTYATGLKMAQPELTVITIMGDGGLGIGGAHVLSSCRRNLDISLLVLNNFNYGMTGGQCSATTPLQSSTASGFLNQLEAPLDICLVGKAAGASYTKRIMCTDTSLSTSITAAIEHKGFAITDIWGICPGRYSKKNKASLSSIKKEMSAKPAAEGIIKENLREEFGAHYRRTVKRADRPGNPVEITSIHTKTLHSQCGILFLGAAGQRINTAGEILCLSAMSAGMYATLKSDYPITVLRGHSNCEAILSPNYIEFTGISKPDIIIALAQEGIDRKKMIFSGLDETAHIITAAHLIIPETKARITAIDFQKAAISNSNRALAALAVLTEGTTILSPEMLVSGLAHRFSKKILQDAHKTIAAFLATYRLE